tara:strand:+ start:300 stop:1118 length:819 start_codon:yes stop_codon:yes gene_type:complete
MNNKIIIFLLFQFSILIASAQSPIVDTEAHLRKIDSTFHLFANIMGDVKKGNVDMFIFRSGVTMGSKFNKNLFRVTINYNVNNINSKKINKNTEFQLRYNFFIKGHDLLHRDNLNSYHQSIFAFFQVGEDFRSFMDKRLLIGAGYRHRIIKEKKGYVDFAPGIMIEEEKYLAYSFKGENYDPSSSSKTRLTANLFSRIDIAKNIKSYTTIYSQWYTKNFLNDHRLFLNQNFRFIINKNLTTFIRLFINYPSKKFVKKIKYNSDLLFGLDINI